MRYGSPKERLVVLWGNKCSHAVQSKEIIDLSDEIAYIYFLLSATNSHSLSVLKQQTFIISQLWRSEAQNGPHWAIIMVSAGLPSFWRLKGRTCCLAFFRFWRPAASLGCWPPSIFKARKSQLRHQHLITQTSASHHSDINISASLLFKDPCDCI